MNFNFIIVHLILIFSYCLCEVSEGQKEKLLNGFVNYYNSLPNQIYTSNEGILENTQQVDDTNYKIVVNIKVSELENPESTKLLICTANVQDLDSTLTVTNNRCQEHGVQNLPENGTQVQAPLVEVTEPTKRKPIELDNEVQRMNVDITSGEQFIAIPRDQPAAPCVGCATHVNPQAPGVTDLANLGVRQLDLHEPTIKHTLESVLDVERQVQVVNGVRYILTLSINFNDCSEIQSENCASSKICKINILVKPWVKLSNGANYRSILSNNCTEDWQFGETGEVLPELPTGGGSNTELNGNTSIDHDTNLQAKHNTDLQSSPNQERTLTDEELKNLQDQIIPNGEPEHTVAYSISTPDTLSVNKEHVFKVNSNRYNENFIPVTESEKTEQQSTIISDKKKAIDELLNFFDFTGYQRTSEAVKDNRRIKRSYDDDLQVLSLAEDFRDIKQSIESAKFVYEMARAMVEYLNEMDIEVKNRAVKNVIKAEEEIENLQRFMYIQAQVTTPCDKVECEPKDAVILICNGVIDSTKKNNPQILNAFCYNDNKESDYRDVVKDIDLHDPVLQSLAKEAVIKIESESNSQYAIRINKIVAANTQITSGTLSKLSIIIDNINCNKSVPWALRVNCTVIEQLGSKICEVIIHERYWLKERKIIYSCTVRPADIRITTSKALDKNMTVNDPKINEMLQEAIQYLETQSNRNNKQKIVSIKSISTQIIAGFLTKIEFIVGYTNCTYDNYARDQVNECELLANEKLRLCKAQIWDRTWIMDGRQVEVSCDDVDESNEIDKILKKRSIADKSQLDYLDDKNKNNTYKMLATESLKKFLHSSSIRQHYEVIKVNRVTTRDVSGKLTRIEFTISPTDCVLQSNGQPSSFKCNVVNPNIVSHCHSKILEQVWLKKKQYVVNCNIKDQNLHLDAVEKKNHTDFKYYLLAEESMNKYLHDTGNFTSYRIVRIENVTTQMVSGLLTTIDFVISPNNASNTIRCNSKILQKPRLATKNINVTCQIQENNNINALIENKLDNPKYMQIAVESLQKYIKDNPDSNLIRVTFVVEAEVIPLTGGLTKIQYVASRAENDDGDTLCNAEFWDQGQSRSHINVKCHLIGAVVRKSEITAEDPNYLHYVQLAEESLQKYIQSINNSKFYSVIGLESVNVKWDDGIKTIINFTISPVDLDNNDIEGKWCSSQIREQPWLNKKHIDISCKVDKELYRTKRQVLDSSSKQTQQLIQLSKPNGVPGGLAEQDPSDPKYKSLAEESLQKYVQDVGSTQEFKSVRVEKVSTQVVSGSLTRIDFVASTSTGQDEIKCHSEIWEQPWVNKKEIKVSCQIGNQRKKRGAALAGGLTEKDPSDPKYKSLAEESLQKYVQDVGSTQKFHSVRIENVTTQVVSGLLTHIHFVASANEGQDKIKCHSEIWEQPWVNKKEIKVSCQIDNQRKKRGAALPGGLTEQDPSDPKYKSLAEESLQKYVQDGGSTQEFKSVRVEKVSTQVVSGSLTRIDFVASTSTGQDEIKCHSEIWEQPWVNKKEIKVSCQIDNQRKKRGAALPGGLTEQDPSDPKYKSLAEESLQKYVQDGGSTQEFKSVRVEKVSTQVVSGSLTRIDFVASTSTGQDEIKCHSEIWQQPWINKKEIKVSCQIDNQRKKRGAALPGGLTEQDPSDPKYKSLAEESLQKYVQDGGSTQEFKSVRVEKVSTQVVSGSLTRIDFVASTSTGQDEIKCHSEIWEQPWVNKKEIKVSCQIDNQRKKRGAALPGGLTEQNPSDPKYKSLAEESLQKYVQDGGSTQEFKSVRVEKVSTQVVSGSLTRIDFVASTSTGQDEIKCHSEIWEQPWVNKKEIKVSCQIDNQRKKRGAALPGGLTEQDPSDPKYKSLAEESLQKYVQDGGSTQEFKSVRVEKVSTQVVSGSLTRIDFVASTSTGQDEIKCHSEIWEQPWVNKKEIKVSCQIDNQRKKRGAALPGGLTEQDPSDPKYKSLAEESLQKYVQDGGSTQEFKSVRVEKVSTQVVSGSLTRIDFVASTSTGQDEIKCHSEIWEQPWVNKKEIKVSCQIDNQRKKRGAALPGGLTEQDPSDPKYKSLAEESLQKYVQDGGSTQEFKSVRVEKVSTQVVSGSLTRIDFVASTSTGQDEIKCHSEIWEQPWVNKKEIKVSCQIDNQRKKRGAALPGGLTEQDPSDPKYKSLAEESLQKYVQDGGSTQEFKSVRVEKVSTQVVSGSLTRIDFVASTSTGQDEIKCHSEIWEQPWVNKKEIKVSCQIDNQRKKRGAALPGGLTEQDPSDPKYKSLAEESLQKYVQDGGSTQEFKSVRVEKVSTQVVSGSLTRIDFVASTSTGQDEIKCHSEIWEQPWVNKKEIKVSCQIDNQRKKRGAALPGGLTEQDPSDPKYKSLAEESLQKYVQDGGSTQEFKSVRVEKVSTQVVSGSLTRIDFVASTSTGQDEIKCHSEIWEQPWVNKKEIKVSCQIDNQRKKRGAALPGGLTEQDPSDPKYKSLAEESLQKYVQDGGSTQEFKSVRVEKVSTQVVSGSLTRIDFVASTSTGQDEIKCHSEIWEQPWVNKKEIKVSCQIDNQRKKRGAALPGGLTEQDPSDPKYKSLAEESLQKYVQDGGSTQEFKSVRVEKVSTQVVSGSLTRIDFVASTSTGQDEIKCHSEIWEQPWVNKKEIKVSCQIDNQRKKRGAALPGGLTEQDPSDPKYKSLAEESLQKYVQDGGSTQEFKSVRVEKVSTQVVSGSLTRIDFVASTSTGQDEIKCHSEIWEQPWVNKKEIKVSCQIDNQRKKRGAALPGGLTEQDPSDPKYKSLAEESLQKYVQDGGSTQEFKSVRVEKVSTQVVSGSLTRIDFVASTSTGQDEIKCHSEIWEQPWVNKKEIKVSCQIDNQRKKRGAALPGGLTEQDPSDPKYKSLAEESLQKYVQDGGSTQEFKSVRVEKVSTQVVSGSLTRIDFVASTSTGQDEIKCHSEIWEQPWVNKKEIKVSCQIDNQRKKRGAALPGGLTEQDPSDPKYKSLAEESLQKYVQDGGSTQEFKSVRVEKVSTQVVSGSLTRIDFVASTSTGQDEIKCHSEIWEQPWVNKKEIKVSCQIDNQRKKRGAALPGGLTEQDPSDPKYKSLAEESLQKYVQDGGSTQEFKSVRVEKVSTQVVSGSLTRIDFVASTSTGQDEIKCHSEIWEQPWVNKKEIKVSCQIDNQRKKRGAALPGGLTEQDPSDPKYKSLAEESLQKYVQDGGSTQEFKSVRVEKVSTQVVSGSLTRIDFVASTSTGQDEIKCHSEIWEQPWVNKKEIKVSCQIDNQRKKRGAALPGGLTEQDPSDPKYKSLAEESLQKYVQDGGSTQEFKSVRVEKVSTQVVSGSLTRIDFVASTSTGQDEIKCHSEIWEQPWVNKKEIKVSCQIDNQRKKRGAALPGGLTEQDPSDPKYKSLAEESLQKYVQDGGSTQEFKSVRVEKVSTQVVSGSLTRIDFVASTSTGQDEIKCHSEIWEQPWVNKKEIKVSCQIDNQRKKRGAALPGGLTEQDPSDPKYKSLAEESLQKYVQDGGSTQEFKSVRVEKVSTQVVSGSLTRIDFVASTSTGQDEIKCHSEIWEQPWVNKKEIKVSCQIDNQRKKRGAALPGGLTEQDPSDPKYKSLAEESLQKYVQDGGSTQEFKSVRVEKVSTQVVSGSLTRIDFVASTSTGQDEIKCHSEIWEQPWINKKEIKVSCQIDNQRKKRGAALPGGLTEQDPSDPKYKSLAEESLQKYVQDGGSTQEFKSVRVEKVSTQVVSGSLTRIDFVASTSTGQDEIKCHSEIWEQPWVNKKEIKVSCQIDNQRKKRGAALPGGLTEQDPSDPKYKSLAEESLQKYVQDGGSTQEFKSVRVEKVSTQVVSGSLTRIDFVASTSTGQDEIKCHSEIWEQPWVNKKEIKVSCQIDNQRKKRGAALPGGLTEQDPSDPKYKSLAEESLQKYVQDGGSTQEFKSVRVEKVSTQVVSGSLTRIDFVASTSTGQDEIKCHSEIWEQPWVNKKEIKVSCQIDNQRKKRGAALPGGLTEQDPSDPKYKSLAEESLQKYVQDGGSTQEFKSVRVEKVSTQVVSGSLTRIDFVASTSTGQDEIKCHSEIWEQPWVNKKEIKVSCQIDNQRKKRGAALPGGLTEQDPSDPKYKLLAEESLQKYVQDGGSTQEFKSVRVEKVSTQVVSGSLTRIDFVASTSTGQDEIKCHSEIWEQPWVNKKEIKVSCQIDNQRKKRGAALPGGLTEQDPSDPKYKSLAEESLQKYVQDGGSTQEFKSVRVEKVSTQVVSGSLTRIDFVASTSTGQDEIKCHSEIWEQPWVNKKEIKVSCQIDNQRKKRGAALPGGLTEQDPSDPKYKSLAEESLQKYVQDGGSTQEFKSVRVEKVSTQVVSGSLTRIDFVASTSTGQDEIKCHSEIWEQPWVNKKEIKVSCQIDNQRKKRGAALPGGLTEQDPSDPKYKSLAEESLQKYVQDGGSTQEFKSVRVEKVSTQVVSGSLTRIDFVASTSTGQDEIKCHSEIWEQPWVNKKEIKVSCQIDNQRKKRGAALPGGLTEQDPSDPKYKSLAEESLQKYVQDGGSTQEFKSVRVEKVSTQVVSGSLTRIDFVASTSTGQDEIKCHSEIWEQPWVNKKDFNVSCNADHLSLRKKREIQENNYKNVQFGGHVEEDLDPDKQEYRLLAEESLRKYERKNNIYHKVLEVKRAEKRVVSGFKYKINFIAAPTECPANITKVRARRCEAMEDIILYCHTEIWDRPWLKRKKIDVQCNGPEEDSDDYRSELHVAPKSKKTQNSHHKSNDIKNMLTAQEAAERYIITSKRKYVHKVTDIHSVSENIADGIITQIEFSMSPTNCLRNETSGSTVYDICEFKLPLIVFHCNAKIWDRSYLNIEKEIKVTCKKLSELKKHKKRELGVGNIRQMDDDEILDEETAYYYADRAVQHINDRSDSNNLHKLVTIHAIQPSTQMNTLMIRMYLEIAETYCLRHHKNRVLSECEEMDGLNHRICLARLWPSPDDELVVRHVSVVCDDEEDFESITGLHLGELIRLSIQDLERSPDNYYKLIHQGEPQLIPTLDSKSPIKMNFIVATTNCTKDVDLNKNPFQCFIDSTRPSKPCHSYIWLSAESRIIRYLRANCRVHIRSRRSLSDSANVASDNLEIQKLVMASIQKLEMSSLHRYKQRVLQINSHSTKLTSGKVTTIDFDVGYTSCLKYEWVENITSCDFLEHLPRRRCVSQIWERLWIDNGRNIDVTCVDDETPLENHIEFESAEMANQLANEALKYIEAKYPHPQKQKIVRIFSLEKQVIAGVHYRMKVEVGYTDCYALSEETNCKLQEGTSLNKFCRINVWLRLWTDHPPNYRVSCDFQEGATQNWYHHVQAEQLFYNFLTLYSPSYMNDYSQVKKRFDIFKNNIKKIHEFNIYEKGTARYGVTRFTDLTYEEFSNRYMGLNTSLRNENQVPMKQAAIPDIKIPQNFDWREFDAVTEVKDQGSCGSCWAFSVTGNIEGQWKMQSGQLVSLSEQELVDCDKLDDGCNGGLPDNAYRAIEQLGGLELETDYPYEGEDDKCLFNKTLAKVQISGAVNITRNETQMSQWLVHNGPISIGINANAMQFYMGGISHPWKMLCNPTNLDHGVLIVGYGVKDYPLFHKSLPYWIVKNSWGKSWGEQGYYRVYRGDGTCGVNQMASSAVI